MKKVIKKSNLKAVRQNNKKKTAGKPTAKTVKPAKKVKQVKPSAKKTVKPAAKKAVKPVPKKTAKATSQKKAFKRADAKSLQKSDDNMTKNSVQEFPFWGRLKIDKNRTTLVIDDEMIIDKITKKMEEGFVHREATHTKKKEYEEINPNPDRDDSNPMYLKRPRKLPKRMIRPHEKNLDMPEHLKKRYEKNNKKNK